MADKKEDPIVAQCIELGLPPRVGEIASMVVAERIRELSRVLERMVELMGNAREGERVTFGAALAQASAELGIAVRTGSEDEKLLLTAAFQVISAGRIPGAPDA